MVMRQARTNDVWRHLFKQENRPLEQVEVIYKDVSNGPDLTFTLKGPICLLCGENGVGKSRALRAFHKALGGELHSSDFRPRIGPNAPELLRVKATVRELGANNAIGNPVVLNDTASISAAFRTTSGESRIYWFDPTVQIPFLLHVLRHDASLTTLLEGVSPQRLTANELGVVSALIGRTYGSVEILEILDYQDHEIVPYFRVTCGDESYGSEDMGLGELSLFFLYWMLIRVEFGSVLLLEEPETFVAPKSQRSAIDLIASKAEENFLFVAITSHSGVIAERIPNSHIDFVSRQGKAVSFMRNPPRNILVERLSLVPPRAIVVLVEDEAAAYFTRALLESGNSQYVSHCTILIAGGESEITSALKLLRPYSETSVSFIGLFDGDQRQKLPKDLNWPTMCLPGTEPPELYAKNILRNHDAIDLLLNRPKERVIAALGAVDGQNHHEWLVDLCKLLNISLEELFRCIASGILISNKEEISSFVHQLDRLAIAH